MRVRFLDMEGGGGVVDCRVVGVVRWNLNSIGTMDLCAMVVEGIVAYGTLRER